MENKRNLIKLCIAVLETEKGYNAAKLADKLELIDYKVSEATLSRINTGKKVGGGTMQKALDGLLVIIKKELGLSLEGREFLDIKKEGWEAEIIDSRNKGKGFIFHDEGRLNQARKVDFFSTAKKEVIEFGLTLNTFSTYFENRSDAEFKNPIRKLLKNGVNFKCYLIEPDNQLAHHYFEDRQKVVEDEKNIVEKIRQEIIPRLKKVEEELNSEGYSGKFRVFKYKHIPNNYFLAVDGESKTGEMMVSHYLYGIKRGKCPVIEFNKSDNRDLFRRYWDSLNFLIKNAEPIIDKKKSNKKY